MQILQMADGFQEQIYSPITIINLSVTTTELLLSLPLYTLKW